MGEGVKVHVCDLQLSFSCILCSNIQAFKKVKEDALSVESGSTLYEVKILLCTRILLTFPLV
jgi:hypothetical protein